MSNLFNSGLESQLTELSIIFDPNSQILHFSKYLM
jgi:hypothetical protein